MTLAFRVLTVLAGVFTAHSLVAQVRPSATDDGPPIRPGENFYAAKTRIDRYFAALQKREGARFQPRKYGYGEYQRWQYRWAPLVYPHGDMARASKWVKNVGRATPRLAQSFVNLSIANPTSPWTEIGPKADLPLVNRGRLQFVTFGPLNPSLMLTGSPVGGLYFSTDAGMTWSNGGTDLLRLTGIAHAAINPANEDEWFVATGDGEGWQVTGWRESFGIYRTKNRGVTWESIGSAAQLNGNAYGWQIKKLLIDPVNPSHMYAATSFGLYKTTNASDPASTVTWTLLPTAAGNSGENFYDIEFKPGDSSTVYASGVGLYKSTDSGATWATMGASFVNSAVKRIALEVTPSDAAWLYALVIQGTDSARLYRYDGSVWADKGPITVHYSRGQSISVSPLSKGVVTLGDVQASRCLIAHLSTFCGWNNLHNGLHADVHYTTYSPIDGAQWAATDGGIFRYNATSSKWEDRNNGIGVATVLRMATSASNPDVLLIGQYDNGTALHNAGAAAKWRHVLGGDGLQPLINPNNESEMYASLQEGYLTRTSDGATTWTYITPQGYALDWHTHVRLNSKDPRTIFMPSGEGVLRSTNKGGTWSKLPGIDGFVWQVYTAPSSQHYLYVHVLGPAPTYGPHKLLRCTGVNAAVPICTEIAHPRDAWIGGIAIDPDDPETFSLSYSGYDSSQPSRVFQYSGATQAWTDQTLDLPPSPISSIVAEAGTNGNLYVGAFTGVYFWNRAATAWTVLGDNLPNAEKSALEINYIANRIRAGTFGRGVWDSPLVCPAAISETYSGTQQAGFYETQQEIASSATMSSGPTTYRAGSRVVLTTGFSAKASTGRFRAVAHGCGP